MGNTGQIKRVLLVDDDASIRELALMGLEGMTDWHIVLAASASEAIVAAKSCPPDLILMDFMMPGMNGMEAFAKLKDDPALRSIPVILMTAKVEADEMKEFIEAGLAGVITKPFDPVTLSDEIEGIVAHPIS